MTSGSVTWDFTSWSWARGEIDEVTDRFDEFEACRCSAVFPGPAWRGTNSICPFWLTGMLPENIGPSWGFILIEGLGQMDAEELLDVNIILGFISIP